MITALVFWLLTIGVVALVLWLFENRWKTRVVDDHEQAPGSGPTWSWAFALRLGEILALARLSAFWYLMYRHWTGTESIEFILLILPLYPEGLVHEHEWTVSSALLFSGFLIVGSMAMASLAFALVNLARRATHPMRT